MDPYDAIMRPLKGPNSSMIVVEGYDMATNPDEFPLAIEDGGELKFAPPTVINCGCRFHVSSVDPAAAERAHEGHSCFQERYEDDPRTWHESLERVLRPLAIGLAVMLIILAIARLEAWTS